MMEKNLGNEFFASSNFIKAAECYSEALKKSSDSNEIGVLLSNRSQCYLKLTRFQDAIDDATASRNCDPERKIYIKATFRRGKAFEGLGQLDKALSDYVEVIKMDPKNVEALAASKRLSNEVADISKKRAESPWKDPLDKLLSSTSEDREKDIKYIVGLFLGQGPELKLNLLKSAFPSFLLALLLDEKDPDFQLLAAKSLCILLNTDISEFAKEWKETLSSIHLEIRSLLSKILCLISLGRWSPFMKSLINLICAIATVTEVW